MSHAALLDADHGHPDAVESVELPDAPPAGTDADVELSEYAQPDAWLILNATAPTATVALRAGPVFAP